MKKVQDFIRKKHAHDKVKMITCYDYTTAKIIDQTDIDCVLVGDSVVMVMHGAPDTTHATVDLMATHTQAVARGLKNKFLIADMPFLSYRKSLSQTMTAVESLVQAGAQAVKLEGATGNLNTIRHIVDSGVPVMGHIGLTMQHIHSMGLKVQGKDDASKQQLIEQAHTLQAAGCFSLVLECVPNDLAAMISEQLDIVTIGIGAGHETDGQVLVMQDLLGLDKSFKPKFVKHYCHGEDVFKQSINQFCLEVAGGDYPSQEYSYG